MFALGYLLLACESAPTEAPAQAQDADRSLRMLCQLIRERWGNEPIAFDETKGDYQREDCSIVNSFTIPQGLRRPDECLDDALKQADVFLVATVAHSLPRFREYPVTLHYLPYKSQGEAGQHLFFDVMARPRVDFKFEIQRNMPASLTIKTLLNRCPSQLEDPESYVRGWHESNPLLTGLREHLNATLHCH